MTRPGRYYTAVLDAAFRSMDGLLKADRLWTNAILAVLLGSSATSPYM
jgi:hypothetical protein